MLKTWAFLVVVCVLALSAAAQAPRRTTTAEPLSFYEFFAPTPNVLQPSEKLLRLQGKQVRIVGFMAQMEDAPTGAFYLCPRPIQCDESGAGVGDLPVASVLVIAPAMKGKKIPFIARALAVTGILEVGKSGDGETALAPIRLILAAPAHTPRHTKP
ncbi:MAG: hypothetical protein U0Y68_13355 [Blastocatellia bacterium]